MDIMANLNVYRYKEDQLLYMVNKVTPIQNPLGFWYEATPYNHLKKMKVNKFPDMKKFKSVKVN